MSNKPSNFMTGNDPKEQAKQAACSAIAEQLESWGIDRTTVLGGHLYNTAKVPLTFLELDNGEAIMQKILAKPAIGAELLKKISSQIPTGDDGIKGGHKRDIELTDVSNYQMTEFLCDILTKHSITTALGVLEKSKSQGMVR